MDCPPEAAIVPPGTVLANYLVALSNNHLEHDAMYALNVFSNDPGDQNRLIDFASFFDQKEMLTFLDEFKYTTSRGISHHYVQRLLKGKLQSTTVNIQRKSSAVIILGWRPEFGRRSNTVRARQLFKASQKLPPFSSAVIQWKQALEFWRRQNRCYVNHLKL